MNTLWGWGGLARTSPDAVLPVAPAAGGGPAKWPISGLLSAEYPMISVCPPRLTSGPQPAHDARPHPHRVFMQQRLTSPRRTRAWL